ncbi:5-(carboxyamino)imidazole ribonucleotide synthase [Bauldia litoralis]|uniref:5-(carboxyamino)imidazole ribonucleotide synthase n=1 Tax=Bauldia litoralis TaxID=665467 RepID=UPI003265815B
MSEEPPIKPGMIVGILGGGQLGRMLALAAAELGLSCHIYCPDTKSPAFAVSAARTIAPYDDESALAAFAGAVDVVTFEFENIPVETLRFLAEKVAVFPGPGSLAPTQDRLTEKTLITDLGIPVPAFAVVAEQADIYSALAKTGRPAILKTRRLGYDGKGQAAIRAGDDPVGAWRVIGQAPAVLESLVPFEREVSVILARGRDGATAAYDVVENVHKDGILSTSTVPASIPAELTGEAVSIAQRIAEALDHVGVLAVEMFVMSGGGPRLLVNEIAPRVHNSGHWTTDACLCSQFEQHIRAIAGWPLGSIERHSDTVMTNLIGDEVAEWPTLAAEAGARPHLYGKAEARPGRKMGHVNRITPRSLP